MKLLRLLALFGLALGVSGCWPERIVWSPDGTRAVVFAENHVYLCDPNGSITDGGAMSVPEAFTWFADSERVAFSGETRAQNWSEVEPLLSDREKASLIESAEAFRADILKNFQGDLATLKTRQNSAGRQLGLMIMYLRDRHPEGLREKLGANWKGFADCDLPVPTLFIGTVTDKGIRTERAVARSLDKIVWCRINSQSMTVAYSLQHGGDERDSAKDNPPITVSLWLAACDGTGVPREVAPNTADRFDWTPDGKSLVYCTSRSGPSKELTLGTISRRQVCQDNGRAIKEFAKADDLAAVFFTSVSVRCLPDGKIFFSGGEGGLPATTVEMPKQASLFALDPGKRAMITHLLPPWAAMAIPDQAQLFAVASDQVRVSLPGQKGQVSIVNLATGEVQVLVPDPGGNSDRKLGVIPSWRAGNELCLLVPPGSPYGSPNRPEVVLYSSSDQFRCISKSWPDSMVKSLSESPE